MMWWVFCFGIIFILGLFLFMTVKEGYTDMHRLAVKPVVFDSLQISDSMYFKERKSEEIMRLLSKKDHLENLKPPMSREAATSVFKTHLGQEYDVVYWGEQEEHYDIVVHAPHKMYGYYLVQKKGENEMWAPKLVGYIFEDKIQMIPGVGGLDRVSDFETWPFNSKL